MKGSAAHVLDFECNNWHLQRSPVPRLSPGAAGRAASPTIFLYQAAASWHGPPVAPQAAQVAAGVRRGAQRGRTQYMASVLVRRAPARHSYSKRAQWLGPALSGTWPRSAGSAQRGGGGSQVGQNSCCW